MKTTILLIVTIYLTGVIAALTLLLRKNRHPSYLQLAQIIGWSLLSWIIWTIGRVTLAVQWWQRHKYDRAW